MRGRFIKLCSVILCMVMVLMTLPGMGQAGDAVPETTAAAESDEPLLLVDGNGFYDLASAFGAAGAGSRITLLHDLSLEELTDIGFPSGEPVILDFNGCTIHLPDGAGTEETAAEEAGIETAGTGGGFVLRSGSLQIVDDSENGSGGIESSNSGCPVFQLFQNEESGTGLIITKGDYQYGESGLIALFDAAGNPAAEPDGTALTVALSGGTYDSQLPESFLADGYEMIPDEDTRWSIREIPEPVTCTVTFDSAADDVTAPEEQTVEKGGFALAPQDPVREGYTFDGWFLNDEEERFVFDQRPVDDSIILKARWTVNTYTVTFDLNHKDAEGKPEDQKIEFGKTVVKPEDPSSVDAIFSYWTAEAKPEEGTEPAAYDFSAAVASDLTLYGYWTKRPEFTVSFDSNGGTGTMDPVTLYQDSLYTIPENTFTAPSGMRFKTWSLLDKEYAAGSQITITEDLTFTAQWEEIPTYTITFHSNGGSGDMSSVTMYEDTSFILPESAFNAPYGKVFAGWDLGAPGSSILIKGNIQLAAQWKNAPVVTCTVTFDDGGGTGKMDAVTVQQGEPYILPECTFIPPAGLSFAGWDKGTAGSIITASENITLKALWTDSAQPEVLYTITFYTAYGESPEGQIIEKGQKAVKPEDLAAAGYNFQGWYTEMSYTHQFDFDLPVNSDLTLYAKWEKAVAAKQFFTIAFYTERGNSTAQQVVESGQLAAKPMDPAAQDYVFAGWYTEKECKNLYDFNSPVTANQTLFAGWTQAPEQSYIVSFYSNGHGNAPNPQTVLPGQIVQIPEEPQATGYTFAGWFTDRVGSRAYDFQTPVSGDLMLYAGWTPNRYMIRFDANEGTGTMSNLYCTYDTRTTLPAEDFTRDGYSFAGWNTQADGTGTEYYSHAVVLNLTSGDGGIVPLYAQWSSLYNVIEGIHAVVPKGGNNGITFRVNGDYQKFTGIRIDGQDIQEDQYTSWAGSTYVRLNNDLTGQMEEGDHSIQFLYTDGSAETDFKVMSSVPAPAPAVRSHNLLLWVIIAVIILGVAACTTAIILLRKRRGRRGRHE